MKSNTLKIKFSNNFISISYFYRKGSEGAKTLLFLHGLGRGKEDFKPAFKFLPKKYSILALDLPGFGSSSTLKNFSYSMEHQARIIGKVASILKLKDFCIIGHSMGGAVGLLFAYRNQRKLNIQSFINVEGNLFPEDCDASLKAYPYSLKDFMNFGFKIIAGKEKGKVKNSGRAKALAFLKSSRSLVEWSYSFRLMPLFKQLKIKKWYVFGEKNKNAPTTLRIKESAIPFKQISESGHLVMADNPKEFYAVLAKIA